MVVVPEDVPVTDGVVEDILWCPRVKMVKTASGLAL